MNYCVIFFFLNASFYCKVLILFYDLCIFFFFFSTLLLKEGHLE